MENHITYGHCLNSNMFNMLREEVGLRNCGCCGKGFTREMKFQLSFFFSRIKNHIPGRWRKVQARLREKANGYKITEKQELGHYNQESGLITQLRSCMYGGNGRKTFWSTTRTRRVYCYWISGKISNSGGNRRHFFALVTGIVFRVGSKGKMYSLKFPYVHWSVELLTTTDLPMVSSMNSTYRCYQIEYLKQNAMNDCNQDSGAIVDRRGKRHTCYMYYICIIYIT